MNYTVNGYHLETGDEIIVPKSAFNLVQHHALFLGYDNGVAWIIENNDPYGVRLLAAKDFFAANPQVSRVIKFNGTYAQQQQLIQIAKAKLGDPYHLIKYNCEHFVNDVKRGISESKQVRNTFLGIMAMLLLTGLASNSKNN